MIGVVVPVHNEERALGRCLQSVQAAAGDPQLAGERVLIVTVLDACTDDSERCAREAGALILQTDARCVGQARALGGDYVFQHGARWLACTDADSVVPADWLSRQLRHRADAVCGTVKVDDWSAHGETLRQRYEQLYRSRDGHRHVHGANLGVTRAAYRAVGGFRPLATGEDVALVAALTGCGLRVKWVADPCVTTSGRLEARAPKGFGAYLLALKEACQGPATPLHAFFPETVV